MPQRSLRFIHVVLLGLAIALPLPAAAANRLLRFPDIHAGQVVFCYAGDLWLAPSSGGAATRLTAHPGLELFPKFSPDGQWIAFTGQYDGDEQVYVVPASGGAPRQLTFYPARGPLAPRWGYDNQVYGWTKDGSAVLFRSLMDTWNLGETRLYTVPVAGGMPVALPMPVSGAGDWSPDEKQMVYNPTARDFRTWKRYAGGWQQDLYIFDLKTADVRQITSWPRTERDPMWIGDKIYFDSDHDGTLNLHVFDLATSEIRQITHETGYDVRWPSDDGVSRIVFELGGELRILDTQTGSVQPVAITVPNDGVAMRPAHIAVDKFVEDFELSPKGERALFVARGDLFTLPIEKGATRNLTNTSNAHERWARWSPNGKSVAYISDASGEDELWVRPQDGSGKPEQLTKDGQGMRYAGEWSPDGKKIATGDKDGVLTVVTVSGGRVQKVADDRHGMIRDYVWSPDSKYLAFSMNDDNDFASIWIWSAGDATLHRVTGDLFDETTPAWDPKGKYLFYLSSREFAPQISGVEWNFATARSTGIFAMALRKDVPHPFPYESDEVSAGSDTSASGDASSSDKKTSSSKAKKSDKSTKSSSKPIDWEGIETRVCPVPVPADEYSNLQAIDGHLIYLRSASPFYGRDAAKKPDLQIFAFKDRKESTLAEKVTGFALSRDGSKVLVQHDSEYKLYDAGPKGKDSGKSVAVKGMSADIVPAEEWAEIFDEVWRRYRDFFYVSNMHGYDWKALGEQYRALLPSVAHRSDLNYVLGEMVAELNVSHAYIAGGDWQAPARPQVALPGARFELDREAKRYRITKIFAGQNEEDRYRSPLTEMGVDARVGDYVMAIDGIELEANDSPYRLLRFKADRPVTLTLNSKPSRSGAREVTYRPITSESDLVYLEWVTGNRDKVDQMTDGKVGYIHVPDMGGNGIREFIKYFYGQIKKEGMIVDVRSNGGGNVSQWLIERLRRELLGTRFSRLDETASTYPEKVVYGPKVCLLDENSSSDGDIFPHMFRQAKLGPLIGKRSWGGVVGITNHGPLLDGGTVNVPQFGTNAVSGEWVVEGHGVDPDIVVENDPKSIIAGRDLQLERGVEEVMRQMRATPMHLPSRPAPPVRDKASVLR